MTMKKDIGLLTLRVGASIMLMTHGIPKFLKLIAGGEIEFGDPIGIGPWASLFLAVIGEFVCPILIIIGYKTRWAVIPPAIVMLVAVLRIHTDDPFSVKEKALLFLLIFVFILLAGPGKYSLDRR